MRFLQGTFIEGSLERGASIEQFLGGGVLNDQRIIRWIEIRPTRSQYEVWLFQVADLGSLDQLDLYEFGTDDIEAPAFKGQSAREALAFAHAQLGATPERWVNKSVVQSEYEDFIRAGRPLIWP